MPHKFIIGQAVEYIPSPGLYAPGGLYIVTAKLPERDGEFEYHIRHTSELHETRVARESELGRHADDRRRNSLAGRKSEGARYV